MYNKKEWQSNELITKEALNNIENGIATLDKRKSNAYFIDLEEWGIHNGFLDEREYVLGDDGNYLPKYTDEEYEIAHNNKEGLNAALQYAVDNGYNTAVLPNSSEIFICWEEPKETVSAYYAYTKKHIILPSNLDFDMNNSTIKVIFDSKNINPYDKSKHNFDNPIYKLNGHLISVDACYNSSIRNGILIGTRHERAYIADSTNETGTERGFDFGTGINLAKGSSFIKIENMEIKDFMADGIASMTDHDPAKGKEIYNPQFNHVGEINDSGIIDASITTSYTTDYLDISDWTCDEGIMRTNIGYTRVPDIFLESFMISFYDENKTFIYKSRERYLQNVLIPTRAKYIRISILREQSNKELGFRKDFQFTPKTGEFCTITLCRIHNNHRGGIANIVNNTIIEKCKIYNNGRGVYEDIPQFPDTTRYAINCEDCLPLNLIIRDCYFYESFHGILFAGGSVHCENNIFNKISGSPLYIYNCENAWFDKNTVIQCGTIGKSTGSSVYNRAYYITNNKFINSSMEFPGDQSIQMHVENNSFIGKCNFNNYTDPTGYISARNILIEYSRIDNVYGASGYVCNNTENVYIKINGGNLSTARNNIESNRYTKNLTVKNISTTEDSKVNTKALYNTKVIYLLDIQTGYDDTTRDDGTKLRTFSSIFDNVEFDNSTLGFNGYNNCDTLMAYSFKDCVITIDDTYPVNNSMHSFFRPAWYSNEYYKEFDMIFENCTFTMSGEINNHYLFNGNTVKMTGNIQFKNCKFINASETKDFKIVQISAMEGSTLRIDFNDCEFEGNVIPAQNHGQNASLQFFKNGSQIEDNFTNL